MDNYPDTTYGGDPTAPWNQVNVWERHTCEECLSFYPIPYEIGDCRYGFCGENCEYVRQDWEACVCYDGMSE